MIFQIDFTCHYLCAKFQFSMFTDESEKMREGTPPAPRVFCRSLTSGGGILTIGCCLRTIDYCFPYCIWNFCGGQGLDGGGQSHDWGDLPVPPLRKILPPKLSQVLNTSGLRKLNIR